MKQFREGQISILIATDLASRGIDVKKSSYAVNYHFPETYDLYVYRSGRTARAGSDGLSLTAIQQEEEEEEEADIPVFQKELGITFHKIKKADAQGIQENNALLWAKKIVKTKPNLVVPEAFKNKIKTVFSHLIKEEMIEKVLAIT